MSSARRDGLSVRHRVAAAWAAGEGARGVVIAVVPVSAGFALYRVRWPNGWQGLHPAAELRRAGAQVDSRQHNQPAATRSRTSGHQAAAIEPSWQLI